MNERSDPISPEIRAVEAQLDVAYRTNRLLGVSRSSAVWMLLGVFEDLLTKPALKGEPPNVQKNSLRGNLLINALKHALKWLDECPLQRRFERRYNDALWQSAYDLLMLGRAYDTIETIFIYASRGHCHLELDGKNIVPVPLVESQDARYYAYNRFVASGIEEPTFPTVEFLDSFAAAADGVRVGKDGFSITLNPKLVALQIEAAKPVMDRRFSLPGDWRTTQYSFEEFKAIFSALAAVAAIQFKARIIAAGQRAAHFGFNGSVSVQSSDELRRRVCRYSGHDMSTVSAVLTDLTYGSRAVRRADPALQPVVQISEEIVMLSPSLILSISPERNLCTLLNSIPEERQIYAGLVQKKEALMREQILNAIAGTHYRPKWGKVIGMKELPDVDLAVIDDRDRLVLLLELKWFIAPDEVSEGLNRCEDLGDGIGQIEDLLLASGAEGAPIQKTLQVPNDYQCRGAVVSQNWIGPSSVQDKNVPIINVEHLMKALAKGCSLTSVCNWLQERSYLPVEGVHFRLIEGQVQISEYTATWWDIEPLIDGAYDAAGFGD